jgi:hypothetical protein
MTVGARALAGLAPVAIMIAVAVGADFAFAQISATPIPRHSAPGPIVGAGLPILAIGFGAYWLVGRFRNRV